ncbi:MAG: GGDEF domain-containing protein [Magnetococcales bacterium]|nr:GGDEF domain-containing protein [Magnetococcales bacterium]
MSTTSLIESIYDLLRQKVPDTSRALSLVQQALAAGVCGEERRRGQQMVEGLLVILEQWLGEIPGVPEAIADCRQCSSHDRDFDRLAQAAAPLFNRAVVRSETRGAKPSPDLAGQLFQALTGMKEDRPGVAALLRSLPATTPSLGQLTQAVASMVTVSEWPAKDHGQEELVWEQAWRRLHHGLQEVTQGLDPGQSTQAMPDHGLEPAKADDRETLIEEAMGMAHEWMRVVGHVGHELDDMRHKGERLRQRIDELEAAIVRSQSAHFIDPRTGLSDHSGFAVRLNKLLDRANHLGELFSLGIVRVDHFEALEASLSTEAMDRLIRSMAEAIRHHLDSGDFIARIAPDRLGILFPRTTADRCSAVINSLKHQLVAAVLPLIPELNDLKLISDGLSVQEGMTVQDILAKVAQLAENINNIKTQDEPKGWEHPVELGEHVEVSLD